MKKLLTIIFALALIVGVGLPAYAATQYYRAEVYKLVNTGDVADASTRITSGITYRVLQTDETAADTDETLGSDKVMTSKTNPVTTTVYNTHDRIDFWCDPTDAGDAQVSLIVVDTNGGFTAYIADFLPTTHKVIIDERPNMMHSGVIWFSGTAVTTLVTDTGIDFLYDTVLHALKVDVITAGAADSIDVGLLSTETSGDDDGLIDGFNLSSTGALTPALATSGALLDDATNFYPLGHFIESANARSLVYSTLSTITTSNGYLHYFFTVVR